MALELSDTIVAGGPGDFMTVRHLVLKGSNRDIGYALAKLARDELGVRKVPWTDPLMTRAQRFFVERNWPSLFERMAGAADAYDADLSDDALDFSFLAYDMGVPGCSCVYYPSSTTVDGHSVVSRNFDYTIGSHADLPVGSGALAHLASTENSDAPRPFCGRPFLMELHPDTGYATLGMCTFDLLGQLTDGINSQGLCVALLNDGETAAGAHFQPFGTLGVGLTEGQVPRFLLENCANIEEAKTALLAVKQYYVAGPCHYLVGDRSGRSFVWEYSSIRNRHHIIERENVPLAVTNHLLHDHVCVASEEATENSRRRLAMVEARLAQRGSRVSKSQIRDINQCVQATDAIGAGQYRTQTQPGRTLWYAYYDLDALDVDIEFYLGETQHDIRRSTARNFRLETTQSSCSNFLHG